MKKSTKNKERGGKKMKKVRLRLKDFLKERGLTFYRACELTGVPETKLRRLAKTGTCTLRTLEVLVNRFNAELQDLVEVVEEGEERKKKLQL